MLKQLKKVNGLLLILVIVLPGFFFPSMVVEAKTLADLRAELEDLEKQQSENEEKQQLTKEEIERITASISYNTNTINQLSNDLLDLQKEIVQAEKDIEEKDKEIKEIINFLQVSSGESAYLEYAFGAKDFTDFIYRMAIAEQLSSYNEELMKKYNKLIESNKRKKMEITEKQDDLRKKQSELASQKTKLGKELNDVSDAKVTILEEIRLQKAEIKRYEDLKCTETESIDDCLNRQNVLPPGTAFYRPIISGRITSEFGSRCYWINQKNPETGKVEKVYKCDLHGGIDMSQSGNVPIYASAPGIVVGHSERQPCGGNMVYVIHNINGKKYTSMYAHLRKISVHDGQVVTMDTQIGIMGGNPAIETWDGCSTGQHLHFTLANGHYLKDYSRWATFEANMFNPRIMLNAPAVGGSFSNRFRKY